MRSWRFLEKAYRDVTGDVINQPFTVGAATFARAMPNTVAFGPIFSGTGGNVPLA